MRIFEFHFQINKQKGKVFDSFCYEPENIREKKLGNLYIVGEVNNTTIQNAGLLDDLAQNIKTKFYHLPRKKRKPNPEKNLKESLRTANIFLQDRIKEGETSWLGNLNLAILNLIPSGQNHLNLSAPAKNVKWELNFAKTGEIKIFLIREGQVSDISQNLESNKKDAPSLFIPVSKNKVLATQKFFGNIATGQLSERDRIAVLTKEVFPVFEKQNILGKIAELTPQADFNYNSSEKKKLDKILKKYKNVLYKNSGVFLFIALENQINETPLSPSKLKEQKEIFEFKPSKISICIQFVKNLFGALVKSIKKAYSKTLLLSLRAPTHLLKVWGRAIAKQSHFRLLSPLRLLAMTIRGLFGRAVFERPQGQKSQSQKFNAIIDRFILAKQEIWKSKQKIRKKLLSFREQTRLFCVKFSTKNILNKFRKLKKVLRRFILSKNFVLIIVFILLLALGSFIFKQGKEKEIQKTEQHLEEIKTKITQAESFLIIKKEDEARLLFQDAWQEILPLTEARNSSIKEEALSIKKSIEAQLDPLNKIERIDEAVMAGEGTDMKILSIRKEYDMAVPWKNSILAFIKPNKLLKLKNGAVEQEIILENALSDFEPVAFSIYYSNLYFLDPSTSSGQAPASGRIIKYPHSKNLEWGKPKIWLEKELLNNAKSMAIDGSVWVLNFDNKIDRYYAGEYRETLELNFFPEIKSPEKIWTSPTLPELYILEPCQKRIIILNKTGGIVKQFISEKFDNLLDFTISSNGKTIYLLNRANIYKIER